MIVLLSYLLCAGGFRIMRYMLSVRERNLDLFLKPITSLYNLESYSFTLKEEGIML